MKVAKSSQCHVSNADLYGPMMKPDEIPMVRERRLLSDLMTDLVNVYQQGLVAKGAPRESMYVAPVLYSASFAGHGISIARISQISGVPRATVERRLAALERAGFAERRGRYYWVPDDKLKNPPANIPRAMTIIQRACQEFQRIKKS